MTEDHRVVAVPAVDVREACAHKNHQSYRTAYRTSAGGASALLIGGPEGTDGGVGDVGCGEVNDAGQHMD